MKFPELETLLTEITGEPAARVRTRARAIRRAGMVTTGGRGPNAPAMTARDLATLMIGIIPHGDETAAPETAAQFGAAALVGVERTWLDGSPAEAWTVHGMTWRGDLLPPALRHLGRHDALSGLDAVLGEAGGDQDDLVVESLETAIEPTGPRVTLHLTGPEHAWQLDYATPTLTGRRIVMASHMDGPMIVEPLARAVMGAWQ